MLLSVILPYQVCTKVLFAFPGNQVFFIKLYSSMLNKLLGVLENSVLLILDISYRVKYTTYIYTVYIYNAWMDPWLHFLYSFHSRFFSYRIEHKIKLLKIEYWFLKTLKRAKQTSSQKYF